MSQPGDTDKPYTDQFYVDRKTLVRASAAAVVPIVLEYVQPTSVIDVGCGDGTWLTVWQEHGVETVVGADGDYVDRNLLEIPQDAFTPANLEKPLPIVGPFDLVMSLEVAEHLSAASADQFVDTLTGLGRIVLFGAAIPFQGGRHHVNEQWQDYWAEKFEARGYVTIDCIRSRVWQRADVKPWYSQNTLVYCHADDLPSHPKLQQAHAGTARDMLRLVHPAIYDQHADPQQMSFKRTLNRLPAIFRANAAKRRARKQ